MNLFFSLFFKAPKVYDWKHQQKKVKNYVNYIKTALQVSFSDAKDCYFINDSTASFKRPTLSEKSELWQSFNSSKTFPFNQTQGQWFTFKGNLQVPDNYDPSIHHLRFLFQIQRKYDVRRWDDDFPAGPEGRFWINGKLIGAIDEFHDGLKINETGPVEVRIFTARCLSSHKLTKFGVQVIHTETEELYRYLYFIKTLYKEIPEGSIDRQKLMDITNQVLPLIDIRDINYPIDIPDIRKRDVNRTHFYRSVSVALRKLKELLNELPQHTDSDPFISVIGYSHLDTVWQWPYNLSHYKFANTAATMLHLLNESSEWHFLATSAQHYKWLEKDEPELFDRIIRAAREKKWEIDGASWVEPDTNIPSGESLVRQLLYGITYFRKLGFNQSTFFVPDCFGFSPALPQILNQCNISNFVTSKISWNEYTEFPHDTFKWRGIDGSQVFAHFITTPCQWAGQASTYTGVASARELVGTYRQYKQKLVPEAALHTAGNGDGGGGVTEEMVWNMAILNELPRLEGVPHIRHRSLSEVFDKIRESEQRLPTWDGELYLEYHRGTATSQEEVKRQNKILEALLHSVEWLSVVFSTIVCDTGAVPKQLKEKLDSFWELTMMYQFHDAVPGTSVNEANVDILLTGIKAIRELQNLEQEIAHNLSKLMRTSTEDNTKIIFNTLSHERKVTEAIKVPSGGWTYFIEDGTDVMPRERFNVTHFERLKNESFVEHKREFDFCSTKRNDKVEFDKNTSTVTTKHLFVEFDPQSGAVTQITDRRTNRKFLKSPGNIFEFYEDRPNNWPAWDIQLYHKEMQLNSPKLVDFSFSDNKVVTKYVIETTDESKQSVISQTITFSNDSPVIDFTTDVDWNEHDKLLKVAFPTQIRSRRAKYGTQFGHQERPTHTNTEQDMAKFEVNGRWCDLSDGSGGIAFMSDVKHGFDVHESVMRMSLLKAPLQTDKWCDFGKRHFSYRLFIHNEPFESVHVFEKSDELITPPIVTDYEQPTTPIDNTSIPMTQAFVTSSNAAVVVETLKPSENGKGFVCRIYEANGGWQSSTVSFPLLNKNEWTMKEVSLLEEEIENSQVHYKGNDFISFQIDLNAFQIKTILFEKKI